LAEVDGDGAREKENLIATWHKFKMSCKYSSWRGLAGRGRNHGKYKAGGERVEGEEKTHK